MLPHLQEGFKQERRELSAHQSYFSLRESYGTNPPGGCHKSDESHDWGKLAQINQGQIILGKPDCLLAQSNLLCVYGASGGHRLPRFQVFPCSFPQPFPGETDVLCSRQGICVVGRKWLMGSTQSRVGNAPSQTGFLSQVGSPGADIGPLFNAVISDLHGGMKCTLMNFADGTKLSGEVDLQKGEPPPCRKSWIGWKNGLMRTLKSSAKTNVRSCIWENMT